jgi:AraC-like DNA-binding protein
MHVTQAQAYTVPLQELRPVIRIAHCHTWPVRVRPRIIYDFELVLILQGKATLVLNGRPEAVEASDLLWIRPFETHELFSPPEDETFTHLAVHFDLSPDFPPTRRSIHQRRPYVINLADGLEMPRRIRLGPGSKIMTRLKRLVDFWQAGSTLDRLAARVQLELTLIDLLNAGRYAVGRQVGEPNVEHQEQPRRAGLSERDRARLKKAAQKIEADYRKPLCAQDLADEAQMSVSHFNRLFRRYTGFSPMDFLRNTRVQKAREFLADPALSVKEIAGLSGFGDPFVFSKSFRRVDGLTPSAYREAILAGHPDAAGSE